MTKKKNRNSKEPEARTIHIEVEGEGPVEEGSAEGKTPETAPEETIAPETENAGDAEAPEEKAEDQEASEDGAEDAQEEAAAGFFSQEKKDEKEDKIAELTDRLQRQMAEFENYRKRTEKEKSTMYDMGARDILEKLLPVVDNFERGLEGADEKDPFAEGMAMIYRQLMTMLTEAGVEPIEAVGKEFDPNLHNAVMHIDDEQYGENIVAEELQKGYKYKDHVIRFSMVKVAN